MLSTDDLDIIFLLSYTLLHSSLLLNGFIVAHPALEWVNKRHLNVDPIHIVHNCQ